MKYIIISTYLVQIPISHDGKILYFDSEEEVNRFINKTSYRFWTDKIRIDRISPSQINADKFINISDIHNINYSKY